METIEQPVVETTADKMLDFTYARIHLRRLVDDWSKECEKTKVRRSIRKVKIDTESLRQKGQLDEDETLVPVRVIDMNIAREQPAVVNYLKNSRRTAIFTCTSNPNIQSATIESEFTRVSTYLGWEIPHYKRYDGAQAHGWDAIEVVYDESKPGRFSLEHIGHDKLFFPGTISDIQQAPRVIRQYDLTVQKLQEWVLRFGFDAEQVETIYSKKKEKQNEIEAFPVFKLFFRSEGIIYVAWFTLEDGCSDWLKKPAPHYLGIKSAQGQDEPVREYPIDVLVYRESEETPIIEHEGRVQLDENKQEAQTAILSAFINGLSRASNIYASTKEEDGTGASLKELDQKLVPGRCLNKPIVFWHPDYPDPIVLKFMQYADTANAQENNQVNFAAMNREDSRKTATEIAASQQQQSLVNSVQLTLFSTSIRNIYSLAWRIVQSQALQNNIAFCLIEQQVPMMNPMTGVPVTDMTGQPQMQTVFQNDVETISQTYDIRAAGDVDVVVREEKINMMMQDWPVVSQTILKDRFLQDLMKLKYPDSGDEYAKILEQGNQLVMMQSMIQRLFTVLQGSLQSNPEALNAVPDQQKADLMNLMQQASAFMPQQGAAQNG